MPVYFLNKLALPRDYFRFRSARHFKIKCFVFKLN